MTTVTARLTGFLVNQHLLIPLLLIGLTGCAGETGPQGPAGESGESGTDGAAGADGEPGADGESVGIAELPPGDENCPFGGTEFRVGDEVRYACNGEPTAIAEEESKFVFQLDGTEFAAVEGISIGVEVDDVMDPASGQTTARPGRAKYPDITLKRGVWSAAQAELLLDSAQTGQPAPIDALLVINRVSSETAADFSLTRSVVSEVSISAQGGETWIDSLTLEPGSIALNVTTPAARDGAGRIRVSDSAGVWGTFDILRVPGEAAGRQHRPFVVAKPVDKASPLWSDLGDVINGARSPGPMKIDLLDDAGTAVMSFQLDDAFPSEVRVVVGPGDELLEEVSLISNGVTAL